MYCPLRATEWTNAHTFRTQQGLVTLVIVHDTSVYGRVALWTTLLFRMATHKQHFIISNGHDGTA